MELSENLGRTATRPLFLIVALFCALAIGLTGVYALRSQSASTHIGVTQPFAFDHEPISVLAHDRSGFRHTSQRGEDQTGDCFVIVAGEIGLPVLVRPSYVLGGRAMVIAYDVNTVQEYVAQAAMKCYSIPFISY